MYKNSITQIRNILLERMPHCVAKETDVSRNGIPIHNILVGDIHWGARTLSEHILWMCDKIETMPGGSAENEGKAGRWIGWVYACLEVMGFTTNTDSRRMARSDSTTNNASS